MCDVTVVSNPLRRGIGMNTQLPVCSTSEITRGQQMYKIVCHIIANLVINFIKSSQSTLMTIQVDLPKYNSGYNISA